ncbi:MAG: hypothetical protein NVS4B8_08260 [Herpetosiphon sp.]
MWQRLKQLIPTSTVSSTMAPRPITAHPRNVAVIVWDPVGPDGRPLRIARGWQDPQLLIEGYCADLFAASGGFVQYRIVDQRVVDGFPVKSDGWIYTVESYATAVRSGRFRQPDGADYQAMLRQWQVAPRIANGAIDELWLFGGPGMGFWESTMAGPGAFWCNSPAVPSTAAAGRRFVIMGFNYERGVDCMLENWGHRAESIMAAVYQGRSGDANMWQRFTQYDQIAPGAAACGNVHFASNSRTDYEWGCRTQVWSSCDDRLH